MCNGTEKSLPLFLVQDNGPAILDSNWCTLFPLNWQEINHVSFPSNVNDKLNDILSRSNVLENKLGTVKVVQAKRRLKSEATPKFCKPRPIIKAMEDKVSDD